MINQKRYLVPAIIGTIFTIVGSLISAQQVSKLMPFNVFSSDKLLHLSCYIILTIFWSVGLMKQNVERVVLKSIVITVCLGVLMEILQYSLFYGRQFEFLDIIANISGSLMGAIIFKRIFK